MEQFRQRVTDPLLGTVGPKMYRMGQQLEKGVAILTEVRDAACRLLPSYSIQRSALPCATLIVQAILSHALHYHVPP